VPRGPTLPPAVPQLAETTSLAQAVEALLLNELQDLGLDPFPQLTAHNNNNNNRQGAAHAHINKRWVLLTGRRQANTVQAILQCLRNISRFF